MPRQIGMAGPLLKRMYLRALGTDPAEQQALSPTLHATSPNAAAFRIFHIASRAASCARAEELAAALSQAGTLARTITLEGRSHGQLNATIGADGDKTSADLLAFLNERLRP